MRLRTPSLVFFSASCIGCFLFSSPHVFAQEEDSGSGASQNAVPIRGADNSPTAAPLLNPGTLSEEDQKLLEAANDDGEVIEVTGSVTPGSDFHLDESDLETFERDDIHHVLSAVPGVYVREEDGYGLRPNIGMRGSGSERSAKIALMEDGIPVAPAPYSAPAAYYFPLTTRIVGIDVLKGPSAILYGPNTVGGSVNLRSRAIPSSRLTTVDIAGGSNLYGKIHASHGESGKNLGALVEVAKLRASGFKQLDGGGSTGFDKNDVQVKLNLHSSRKAQRYSELELRFGYSTEQSNETYTGLTQEDFELTPYRRYAATQLGKMHWNHERLVLAHTFDAGSVRINSELYGHRFDRTWRKLNGFNSPVGLPEILQAPNTAENAAFVSVLQGLKDSELESEALQIGDNHRLFHALGLQSQIEWDHSILKLPSILKAGVRLHGDRVYRRHTEDRFLMRSGRLNEDLGAPTITTRDAVGRALAFASFVREELAWNKLRISAGLRTEIIRTEWLDNQDESKNNSSTDAVLIPGAGVFLEVIPEVGLLAGAYKGFVPGAPSPTGTAQAEESINFEAGGRFTSQRVQAEAIGFFNNYSNLKGSCTFSSGCMETQVDLEFAGGSVFVWGVESALEAILYSSNRLQIKNKATYTFTHSNFRSSFESDNPQWGDVEKGDELPYLPSHLLSGELSLASPSKSWLLAISGRFTSRMRNTAGKGSAIGELDIIPAYAAFDFSAQKTFYPWGTLYFTANNLLDTAYAVSYRPYGARPGAPRRFILGYKNTF